MKDELDWNITTEVVRLRPKTYSYLLDDDTKNKKAKGTKSKYNKTGLSLMIVKKKCLLSNKLHQNYNKDLQLKNRMHILKKLTRLH